MIGNRWITNFEEKANIFNDFFAEQCSVLNNSSTLPKDLNMLTNNTLSFFEFTTNDILKLLRGLDENKAHGHDGISIRMLKLCDTSIIRPLSIIFNNCLHSAIFPDTWKKANIVPIHKKK